MGLNIYRALIVNKVLFYAFCNFYVIYHCDYFSSCKKRQNTIEMASSRLQLEDSSLPLNITDGLEIHGEPKQRKRLTDLSPEKRQMVRKIKNRLSAKASRDRKKQRMN